MWEELKTTISEKLFHPDLFGREAEKTFVKLLKNL
jgi:hypothetical protein